MNKSKLANIGVWVLSAVTAALFLLSAMPKFFMPDWLGRFEAWGYPEWFMYVIAILEAAGAVGLLIPRIAPYAAGGLMVLMLGAMYTHLTHAEGIVGNLIYIVSLTIIGVYRWRQSKT